MPLILYRNLLVVLMVTHINCQNTIIEFIIDLFPSHQGLDLDITLRTYIDISVKRIEITCLNSLKE